MSASPNMGHCTRVQQASTVFSSVVRRDVPPVLRQVVKEKKARRLAPANGRLSAGFPSGPGGGVGG